MNANNCMNIHTVVNLLNKRLYFGLKESQTKKASSLIGSLDVVALDIASTSNANATEMKNIGKCHYFTIIFHLDLPVAPSI